MEYDQFIDRVAERTRLSREHVAMLTQATLQVLADRISGGQADDLAAVLPDKLARALRESPRKPAKGFDFDEFVGRVRSRVPDLPYEAVIPGIRAVLLTLRDAVPDKEFRDTLAQLPGEFRQLLEGTDVPPQAPLEELAAVERGQAVGTTGQADDLVHRIAERAGVPPDEAARIARATLEVLGVRIGGQQAHALARRLPEPSAEWLDEPSDTPAEDYGPDDFVSRIRDLAPDVPDDDVTPGIRAVILALRDTAGETEVDIALRPLPGEYDELLVRAG